MNRRDLIASVKVRKPAVYVGEPLAVTVVTLNSKCDEPIEVTINRVPGKSQYLQFTRPGRRKITVVASARSRKQELRSLEVQVLPRPDKCDGKSLFPIIGISQNFLLRSGATFRLDNPEDFSGLDVYYVWELGKNIRLTSTTPILDYSFDDRLDTDAPYTSFDIELHVKTRDNKRVYSGRRTLAVWNTYYLNKRRGFIQLKVEPEIYARREGVSYTGRFTISNLEPERVIFNSAQIEYLYDDPEKLSTPGRPYTYGWKIGPKETIDQEFTVSAKEFPKDAFGFAIHFRGQTHKKLPAFADVYFEVRTNPRTVRVIRDPDVLGVLHNFRNHGVFRNRDVIPLDQLPRLLDSNSSCQRGRLQRPLKPVPTTNVLIGKVLKSIGNIGKLTKLMEGELPEPIEGQECTPEDEVNPRGGLICQLTDEYEWVAVPARIINARKGDVWLAPGGTGPIGGLLQQVSPPQIYVHTGIMVNNYYMLKHSTASIEWLNDAVAGGFGFWGWFMPSLAGSEGLDPDKLKYIWPGTICQSVEEGFEGTLLDDPDGLEDEDGDVKQYTIKAFSNATKFADNIGLIDPLVVKPDPQVEANLPEVRQMLHRVADSAMEIEGHYRFYCYTEADVFFDDFYRAPSRGWLADKPSPTVCSSFVWAAAKRLEDPEIRLEGMGTFTQPSDLEGTDEGEVVDYHTRDGLYYYSEEERRVAGAGLYDYFYNEVLDTAAAEAPIGVGEGEVIALSADAADDLANQVCNTFAFDWSGEDESGTHAKDSDRWRNPSDGRAVSPDNIWKYWDAPTQDRDGIRGLYGYSERLIYRPARLELRQISRWTRVEYEATLRGRVLFHGETVSGAVVNAAGRESLTNNNGEFEMTIPAGRYRVEAGKLIDGWFMSAQQDVRLDANESRTITLNLSEPDELYRKVTVRGSMYITDDEDIWADEHKTKDVFMPDILVGRDYTHAEDSQTVKMGGEIRVELWLDFDWKPADASIDVSYRSELWESDTETSTDPDDRVDVEEGTVNVPRDRTVPLTIDLTWEGGDSAQINLQISNDRQP